MRYLDDLKDKLHEELRKIASKQEMSAGDLEATHKLTDTIKNIDKICMLEDDNGHSQTGEWEAEMRGNYGRGNSYRIRRDERGRYSRDGMHDGRNGGGMYSRAGDGRERMIEEMERLMENADSEKEREAIRRCISQLEKA